MKLSILTSLRKSLILSPVWGFVVAFPLFSGCEPSVRVSPSAAENSPSPSASPSPSSTPTPGPITLNLLDPSIYQSSDSTPTFFVTGLHAGESLSLFGDEACTENKKLTSIPTVNGSTAQITSPTLATIGVYHFSARAENSKQLTSPCVALSKPYTFDTVNPATCTSEIIDDYTPSSTTGEAFGASITQDSKGALFTIGYERENNAASFSLIIRKADSSSSSFITSLSKDNLNSKLNETDDPLISPTATQGLTIAGNSLSSSSTDSFVIAGGKLTTGGLDYALALHYESDTWSVYPHAKFPGPTPTPSPLITPLLNSIFSSAISSSTTYPLLGGSLQNAPVLGYFNADAFNLADPTDFRGGNSFARAQPLALISVRQPTTHSVSVISAGERTLGVVLNRAWYTRISFTNPQNQTETPQDLDDFKDDAIFSPHNFFQSAAHGITTPLHVEKSIPDVTQNLYYVAGEAAIPLGQGTLAYPEGKHWLVRKVDASNLSSASKSTLDIYQYEAGQDSSAQDITYRTSGASEPDLFVLGSMSDATHKYWSLRSLRSGAQHWYNAELFQYQEGLESEPKKIFGSGNTFYVVGSGLDSTHRSHLLVKKYTCN